jgi:hypothetical protein
MSFFAAIFVVFCRFPLTYKPTVVSVVFNLSSSERVKFSENEGRKFLWKADT